MKRYSLILLVLLFCQFVGAQQLAPFRRGDRVAFVAPWEMGYRLGLCDLYSLT